jgi:MFS family permease
MVFSIVGVRLFNAKIDGTAIPLYCGAGTALVAALLNLTLPNTPPPAKGKPASIIDVLGLRALGLLKSGNFAFFMFISMIAMIPFTMYFSFASQFFMSQGFTQVTAIMSWGQIAEMLIMLLVPIALTRYGAKWAIAVGLGMLVVRYAAFLAGSAFDQMWLYYIAILVHGAIFGFLIVGGQVYVDKKAPPEIKAQAQGLVGLLLFGVGMLIGTLSSGKLIGMYTSEKIIDGVAKNVTNWNTIWLILTVLSAALCVVFWLLFRDDVLKKAAPAAEAPAIGGAEAAKA